MANDTVRKYYNLFDFGDRILPSCKSIVIVGVEVVPWLKIASTL